MTVIAAIPQDDHVVMAADTLLCRRGSLIGHTNKITRLLVGPEYERHALLAIAGSHALARLAQHRFSTNSETSDLSHPNAETYADEWAQRMAIRLCKIATSADPPLTVDDGEMDGEALLAFGPWLWLISGQAATRITTAFAIGSGAAEARGALHAAGDLGLITTDPRAALCLAVHAAMNLDASCGGTIDLEDTQTVISS